MRAKTKKPTRLQGRQRELAWALYCAEGYVANVAAGLGRNARHMTPDDMLAIKEAVVSVVGLARKLRRRMARLA